MESIAATSTGRRTHFSRGPIDGQAFKELTAAGLTWLRTNQQVINELNVFPVPDGDTGTNMVLTMQAAWEEIANSKEVHMGRVIHQLAQGALMGARGNSGVILSQLWRGFARALAEQSELNASSFVEGFQQARDTAYRGVVRPVEGTILTVSADMAEAAKEALSKKLDVLEILEQVVTAADQSVQRTPDLLPVLREAGVVDSGGMGLFILFEGMLRYIQGDSLDTPEVSVQPLSALDLEGAMQEVEPGQDYEVIVDFRPGRDLDLTEFYADLEEMGSSIQIGEGDGLYRVHIHVPLEKRYEPIEYAMSLGTISKVRMENLMAQMEELESQHAGRLQLAPVEPGQIAIVAVSPGPGISRVFAGLGAAAIVGGGQTMNPSTQEILAAFENLPTDRVVILPNNKNIIMAAQAAAELTVKRVAVVPSRTVPQGLAAMLCLDAGGDFDAVVDRMHDSMEQVETGEITTATRNVEIDGVQVKEGKIIALHNGRLVLAADAVAEAVMSFLEHAKAGEFELITLFYGEDVPKNKAVEIADLIRRNYPEQEVELQEGGQPHYQFIFSIE